MTRRFKRGCGTMGNSPPTPGRNPSASTARWLVELLRASGVKCSASRLQPLGRGGYVQIAQAYRTVARARGLLKTLAEKMRENPRVAELFGAADFKPFAYMRLAPNTPWKSWNFWSSNS